MKSTSQKFIINCSRRLGKSTLLCLYAVEFAIKNPGSRICYAAPTQKMVSTLIQPLMNWILQDCPSWIKPTFKTKGQKYVFPNGSEICLAGTDSKRAESLRGQSMHLGIIDEAAFMSDLQYVLSDVLMPQTLTTGGRMIIASTPARDPDHDFTRMVIDAEVKGNYIKKTIYDNPLITTDTIVRFMMETDPRLKEEDAIAYAKIKSGPPNNSTWWREYMAESIPDKDRMIIPEFFDLRDKLCIDVEKPEYYDNYVSMDIGFEDFTAVIFGYWDFLNARIIIEGEVLLNKMTTKKLAEDIADKEKELWGERKPYMRYSDIDKIVINDLQVLHNLTFTQITKDNLQAGVNNLRMMIAKGQIIISPKCVNLIAHLKHGSWNKAKDKFARSGEYGHFDALAALVYLARNIQQFKNPIPPGHHLNIQTQFFRPDAQKRPIEVELMKIFNPKKFFPDS